MSRADAAREKYQDTSPAYNMAGSLQRHNKELLLDILCEMMDLNDSLKAQTAVKNEPPNPPVVTPRQKVTVNS